MANSGLDETTLKAAIAKARETGVIANTIQPRANSAYYDQKSDGIVINLKSGATFSFPSSLAQNLAGASSDILLYSYSQKLPSGIIAPLKSAA